MSQAEHMTAEEMRLYAKKTLQNFGGFMLSDYTYVIGLLRFAESAWALVIRQEQRCHICGEVTQTACSDCQIDLKTTVYVCGKKDCRDEHEKHCGASLRQRIAELEQAAAGERLRVFQSRLNEHWGNGINHGFQMCRRCTDLREEIEAERAKLGKEPKQ